MSSQEFNTSAESVSFQGWLLIPAKDEEVAIAGLIVKLRNKYPKILVVADNCSDQTALIAYQEGAQVIERRGGGGKGMALRYGWLWLAKRDDADFVVLLDGDGQHNPDEVIHFIQDWKSNGADLILGNRAPFRYPMPLLRRITNRFMSWWVSRKTGCRIHDSQCGFRLLSRKLFSLPDWRAENFEIETEIILRAAELKMTITEVPVSTCYSAGKSHISSLRDTKRWVRFISE